MNDDVFFDPASYFMGKNAGDSGTSDYDKLSNRPQIGGVTLSGNQSASDLGLVAAETGKVLSTNDFTDANKSKLDNLYMPTKVSELTNDADYQNAQQVEDKIEAKVSSAYKAGGSATMATLPALTAANLGLVVNMSEDFVTTADFLEGPGKTYPAGTNVVVALAGENVYKYDVLSGFVDLSGKQDKLPVTGAENRGVYVSAAGSLSPMTHTLDKDVPPDAKFTDTTYDPATASANGLMPASDKAFLDALPRDIIVTITPSQSGSGDPSPDNVRPLLGYDTVSVARTGKNLFDPSVFLLAGGYANGEYVCAASQLNNKFGSTGSNPILVDALPDTQLVFSVSAYTTGTQTTAGGGLMAVLAYTDGTETRHTFQNNASQKQRGVIVSTAGKTVRRILFTYGSGATNTWYISDVQLEYGNAVTAYEPYQSQSVTVALDDSGDPLTVYGGTLNVTTGELTVTWADIASYNGETLPGVWMSDRDVYAENATPTTGAQVVYELAAPVAYQLAPAQITALPTDAVTVDVGSVGLSVRAVPVPATAAPLMDGTANAGTSEQYARADHVHETDTSRASVADVTALQAENALLRELLQGVDAPIYRTASGAPAIFEDGYAANVKALSVTLTPAQSGSGDPYPPGGGKNLLNITGNGGTSAGVTYTVNRDSAGNPLSITANGTSTGGWTLLYFYMNFTLEPGNYILNGNLTAHTGGGGISLKNASGSLDITARGNNRDVPFTITADTGLLSARITYQAGYSFNNAVFQPMIRRASDTDPTFAPYSNIRPISGVSSVSVTRTGKNLFDVSGILSVNLWAADENGVLSGPSSRLYDAYKYERGGYKPSPAFKANTQYTLSMDIRSDSSPGAIIRFRHTDGTTSSNIPGRPGDFVRHSTTSAPGKTVAFVDFTYSNSVTSYLKNIQLEEGAEASAYEPYQSQSVTVALDDSGDPLTVYGGTLNVTTGELTVTWADIASYNGETLPGVWMSDRDVYAENATPTTGAQVVYELAAPVAYQLAPAQLATLSGYNAVSSDAESVSVTYRADPSLAYSELESNLTNAILSLGVGF